MARLYLDIDVDVDPTLADPQELAEFILDCYNEELNSEFGKAEVLSVFWESQ